MLENAPCGIAVMENIEVGTSALTPPVSNSPATTSRRLPTNSMAKRAAFFDLIFCIRSFGHVIH